MLRLAGALLLAAAWPLPLAADEPWAGGPFTANPAALLAEARSADGQGKDAVVLLDEVRHELDAEGRATSRHWLIFKVLTAAGQSDWGTLGTDWSPWHQEAPRLKARVIAPDGTVSELDSRTVAESPASELDPAIFSDRRVARAPLPGIAPGAVVEQEIAVAEKAPLFEGGVVRLSVLGRPVPVRTARVVLSYPEALAVTTLQRGGLGEPRRSVEAGRVRLTWEASSLAPLESPEPGLPSDQSPYALVGFATGRSWAEVARRYGEVVDRTIAGSPLAEVARAAVKGAKDRAAIAQRLLALVQREVRYTGLEFGESSILPRPPSETRAQRYGDCKDKAVYLTALLRAAGVPAQLALLNTGPGPDVLPELPGLGVFDHAIVYVPGAPAIWIDPTDELARAGQLPLADQGRLALVASRETIGLLRTPEPVSSENRMVETREFTLPERGRARVVETTESWGTLELQQRRSFHAAEKKTLQLAMESYAKAEYLAKGSVSYDSSAPDDLSRPFRVRLETADAGRGVVDERQAAVALFPPELAQRLSAVLGLTGKDDDETPARKARERKADFVLFEPYQHEVRYRVVPPPGYAPAPLPESGEVALGTAKLHKTFAVEDGAVTAVLRFDTGKRRLTPAELEATKKALTALRKDKPLAIRFEQVGEAHLAAGRVREALSEFRALRRRHPAEGLHHAQVALALLKAGLGEAARKEARAGVAAEPRSAIAQRTLGWVLQHDLLGRRFKRGFDRAGALEAYRRARQLDSEDLVTRGDLAILLEHDPEGVRYGPGADLEGALAQYRAIAADLDEHAFDTNLLYALVFLKRWPELAEAVKTMEPVPERDALRLVGLTAASGAEAALSEAAAIPAAAARREAVEAAGRTLAQLRLYPQAAALLEAAAAGSANPSVLRSQADALRRTRPHEELPLPESDPKSVVKRFLLATWLSREPAAVRALFTRSTQALDTEGGPGDEQLRAVLRSARAPLRQLGLPPSVLADLSLALLQLTSEGDDATGYRVRVRGASQAGSFDDTVYVTREEGAFRIATTRHTPWLIGVEALARADRGDLAGARRWLDWAREEISLPGGDDPLAGAPFARLWTRGRQGDAAAVRLAASALLLSAPGHAARALPVLKEAWSAAEGAARTDLDLALAALSLREKRWAELLEVAGRLRQARPESRVAFAYTLTALRELSRADEARRLAEERLKLLSDDAPALRALAGLAGGAGDYGAAAARYRRLVELGVADDGDYNNLAWNALFQLPQTAAALEEGVADAQRALDLSRRQSSSSLHTLACLYVELGKTAEAQELALAAMDAGGREEPEAHDWYVLGRLAEQYGEREAARDAYLKVTRSDAERDLATSTYLLAQRRLAALDKPGKG